MPPKEDVNVQKRKYKTKKKKEGATRSRKTDRVVIHKQARDMIAKVYEFMKKEAVSEYAEKLTNARWRTATAVGVSEKTVSRILKERAKAGATKNVDKGTGIGEKANLADSSGNDALKETTDTVNEDLADSTGDDALKETTDTVKEGGDFKLSIFDF